MYIHYSLNSCAYLSKWYTFTKDDLSHHQPLWGTFDLKKFVHFRGTLGKKGNEISQAKLAVLFDWYAEDSKGNSNSNLVSVKDSLAKTNEPADRLKEEQIRLIFLVNISPSGHSVASLHPVVPLPPFPSDLSSPASLHSSPHQDQLPFHQQLSWYCKIVSPGLLDLYQLVHMLIETSGANTWWQNLIRLTVKGAYMILPKTNLSVKKVTER